MTSTGVSTNGRRRRVVVTGMGVLSSIGNGVGPFTDALRAGRVGTTDITRFDTREFPRRRGHQVADFEPGDWIHNLPLDEVGPAAAFAIAATRMAMSDAGLSTSELHKRRRGFIAVGTTDGGVPDLDGVVEAVLPGGLEDMPAVLARRVPASQLSVHLARELGLRNVEAVSIATACAAGNYAIGAGLDAVRSGEADYALVGGADVLCRKTLAGFTRLGLVAEEECRPFDAGRDGLLLGEGAGMLVLEDADSARARGARVYAEVMGYGLNCDAHHPVAPERGSVGRCMRLALDDAGITPEDVDLVSVHGTGTETNDITEAQAMHDVFDAKPPRVTAVKSMIGHTMGAASALGAVAAALAIHHGFVPPTANHRLTDPECALDCTPNRSVAANVRIAQNTALAFGGNNAVLVLGSPDGRRTPPAVRNPREEQLC
ncbi:beta-ketoacyl-[acyl-carrier-protein] synthase family protein [Streptomyces cellostaticus]|uniref:beta-ketoacyl-[acyl-carrier-protein] synthase family protein n=1 Tax=Streptomyces cellostaticus TaxID=67285 RepID=UPI002026D00C|nr:beta-ketoacyl-[acyl-carrier-protein] synthase family protein [Streptomyces cellostaticus]